MTNRKLNMSSVNSKLTKPVSSKEALKNTPPINWNSKVLEGKQKVIVK